VSGPFSTRPEPSRRGRDVLARFLCFPLPLDPGSPTQIPAGKTIRETVSQAVALPACSACHAYTDPVGFAFGHFDAVGAFQLTEAGLAIDTTGQVKIGSIGAPVPLTDAPDLARILADAPDVSACFALKWLAFASGTVTDPDTVSLSGADASRANDATYVVKRATIKGGLSLRGTIRAVTETHTFLDP